MPTESATSPHYPDGRPRAILARWAGWREPPHQLRGAGEKRRRAGCYKLAQRLARLHVLPGEDADKAAHLIAGEKRPKLLLHKVSQRLLARQVLQFLRIEAIEPRITFEGHLEHFQVESVLALEVIVDRRLVDAGFGHDRPYAGTLVAVFGEERDSGLHDVLARVVGCAGHRLPRVFQIFQTIV